MGGRIEINDTLQITTEQGFPADILDVKRHQQRPILLEDIAGRVFEFRNKKGARLYQPARCFLVHNLDGKWIYWGMVMVIEQTIKGETPETQATSGKYRVIRLLTPEEQVAMTRIDAPEGKSYF